MRFNLTRLLFILILFSFSISVSAQILLRGVGNLVAGVVPPPGDTLVEQEIHPRVWNLTPSNFSTIAAKLNAYYDDNPTTSYPVIVGSIGDVVDEMDSTFGATSNLTNALLYASTYCFIGHILPSLTTGGATGINPDHTATEYGEEGARLAAAITSSVLVQPDGGFPNRMAVPSYDWCYDWLDAGERTTVGTALMNFETNCDLVYSSVFAADSHKSCSAMFEAATAVAGDTGTPGTWGTNILTEYSTKWSDGDTGVLGSESKVANLYVPTTGYAGSCMTNGLAYVNYSWEYDVLATETYRFAATTQTRAEFYQANSIYSFLSASAYCLNNELRPYARTSASGIYPNDLDWRQIRWQFGDTDQTKVDIWGYTAFSVMGTIWSEAGDTNTGQLGTWLQRNRIIINSPSSFRIPYQWLTRFTMENPTITPASPSTLNLPLSVRTGDGRFVFRSAWDGDSTTNVNSVVQFYLSNFSVPGNGREAGTFSGHLDMYRKGPGLIGRGASGHQFYCNGCLNTLTFQDTSRTMPWSDANDWASKSNGRINCCYNQPNVPNRGADIILNNAVDYLPTGYVRSRFSNGGTINLDYVWADRTRWYTKTGWYTNATSPASQTAVKTEIVNFRPPTATGAARVIRREYVVNTSNQYVPTMGWNPSADSISFTNGSPSAGSFNAFTTFGQQKSTNTSILTASSAYNLTGYTTSTRNTLTIVLPSSASVVVAGGPDENTNQCTFTDTFGGMSGVTTPNNNTSLEGIDVFGFRWAHGNSSQCADPEMRSTLGIYGAFIQPTSIPNGTAINFLLCYELDDNGSTAGTCTTLTSLTNMIGAQFTDSDQNMLAVFSTDGLDITTGAFTIPSAGTYKAIVSDLGGSSRVFSSSGCFTATDSSGDTDLTFAVDSESHTIVMTIITSGANCAVSMN